MPLPANGKSILMTPDPYHTPGYGGFCPQFKYQIGETFGKTTSTLLRNNEVASSGQLVLAEIRANSAPMPDEDPRNTLLRSRTHSWGDQKLMEQMIPGYTGFIPRAEHFFGKRYAVNCKGAISDFERDHRTQLRNAEELRLTEAVQSGKIDKNAVPSLPPIHSRHITPLKPIAASYTGFVPRARPRLGMGYPIITHEALNEFTSDTSRLKALKSQPIKIHRDQAIVRDSKLIYPTESGLVPHYTGHIPGQKFRYGETFGHSTENAKLSEVRASV
ncbi:F166B-like protein [Mya arenaria]|uniref:F166B-like protein n=1 Tax=Mya arenaria TaxID=6604 RepID=A0ABY7GC84_MYAAR|nr:F166B-like protein [Mya arenaria]